jgi:hypothetical protein
LSRLTAAGPSRRVWNVIARNFIDWGGFYDIKPIEKSTPITNEDLFGTSHIDHIRMRRTIRKLCDINGLSNPYEYTAGPKQAFEQDLPRTADHVEWEPLPGYESSTEDVPVPIPSSHSVEVTSQPHPPPTMPSSLSAIPDNPIAAPSSADPKQDNSSPLISPSDTQPVASRPTAPNPLHILENKHRSGMPSKSVQNQKVGQIKAARNLVKQAQRKQRKEILPTKLNSTPENNRFIRSPVGPALETQDSTIERLKSYFKGWF